jgi:hypothetical protein
MSRTPILQPTSLVAQAPAPRATASKAFLVAEALFCGGKAEICASRPSYATHLPMAFFYPPLADLLCFLAFFSEIRHGKVQKKEKAEPHFVLTCPKYQLRHPSESKIIGKFL